jgi:hexosaminidase
MMDATALKAGLLPTPLEVVLAEGSLGLRGAALAVATPPGPAHDACREVLTDALTAAGAQAVPAGDVPGDDNAFSVGEAPPAPDLPTEGLQKEAYALAVGPGGVVARAASPAGLMYAAQTLRQLVRVAGEDGRLPCLAVRDAPHFALRAFDSLWYGFALNGECTWSAATAVTV